MTHTPSHIIITAVKTPITENGKWQVWHALVACLLVGLLTGLAF